MREKSGFWARIASRQRPSHANENLEPQEVIVRIVPLARPSNAPQFKWKSCTGCGSVQQIILASSRPSKCTRCGRSPLEA